MYIWVDPGWLEKALVISALPAFFLGAVFVRELARLGVSELASFMSTMPALILGGSIWSAGFSIAGSRNDRFVEHQPVRRCRNILLTTARWMHPQKRTS